VFLLLLKYVKPLAATDPFVAAGVATCEVIQFRASQKAPGVDRPP
jgi:hypothetical protein